MRTKLIFLLLIIISILAAGCAVKPPVKVTASEALLPKKYPTDQILIKGDLIPAINSSIEYLGKTNQNLFEFGKVSVSKEQMLTSLKNLKQFTLRNPNHNQIIKYIISNFNFHQSVADKVLITGYYVPQIDGSLNKNDIYKYPLYSTPDDLVSVTLDAEIKSKLTADTPVINRGRLDKSNVYIPYYSRKQIDSEGILNNRGLEIVYLKDPIERFFAHIQGSVHITLDDGNSILAAYENKNGQPYRAIGKKLIELGLLQKNNVTMDTIKNTLKENINLQEQVLNWNPSYVFFKLTNDVAKGSLNTPVIQDISVATDQSIFPKSALGLLNLNGQWLLVANHDTGGAITGPGRVDFFFGLGRDAGQQASGLQSLGMIGFLSPKI